MPNIPLEHLIQLLTHYRYWIIFPIAIVEGPIISAVTGFLSANRVFHPVVAYLLLCLGDLVGDVIYYFIGYFGRATVVEKYGHKFGMPAERVAKLEDNFNRHTGKILMFGKTQPYGSLILLYAGAAKSNFQKFLFYNLVGTMPKTLIFFLIGYLFGYGVVNKYLNDIGLIAVGFAIVLLLGYFFTINKLRSKNRFDV